MPRAFFQRSTCYSLHFELPVKIYTAGSRRLVIVDRQFFEFALGVLPSMVCTAMGFAIDTSVSFALCICQVAGISGLHVLPNLPM